MDEQIIFSFFVSLSSENDEDEDDEVEGTDTVDLRSIAHAERVERRDGSCILEEDNLSLIHI